MKAVTSSESEFAMTGSAQNRAAMGTTTLRFRGRLILNALENATERCAPIPGSYQYQVSSCEVNCLRFTSSTYEGLSSNEALLLSLCSGAPSL